MKLQFDAKKRCTVVTGESGTGKTSLVCRYLVADRKLTCRFIFDPEGEFEERFGLPAAETPEELTMAVEDGFCIFDPTTIFGGEMEQAFDWFCQWAFAAASNLPGRKVFYADEAWKYCTPNKIPSSLKNCVQTGRKRGLEMVFSTQLPHLLNGSIRNEVSELVCFRLSEIPALEWVQFLGANPTEIAALPDFQFVARNRRTRVELRGRMRPPRK